MTLRYLITTTCDYYNMMMMICLNVLEFAEETYMYISLSGGTTWNTKLVRDYIINVTYVRVLFDWNVYFFIECYCRSVGFGQ